MKKFLLVSCLCMAIAVPASAGRRIPFHSRQHATSQECGKALTLAKISNAAEAGVWQPGEITYFVHDGNDWSEQYAQNMTYYPNGVVETLTQEDVLMKFEYDDLWRPVRVVASAVDDPGTTIMTYSFEYDTVVTTAMVKVEVSINVMGMDFSEAEGLDVIRNADGNVVRVEEYVFRGGESVSVGGGKHVYSILEMEYGSDGEVSTMLVSEFDDSGLVYAYEVSDIEWENTDGQILSVGVDENNLASGLFVGANRIKSGVITDTEDPENTMSVNVDYFDDGFDAVMKIGDMIGERTEYRFTDALGSFHCNDYNADFDVDDSGELVVSSYFTCDYTHTVDKFGLVLENTLKYEDWEEGMTAYEIESTIGTVEYDDEFGYPVEYTTEEYDDEELYPVSRAVYSDYEYYTSGVGEKLAGDADMPAEYYDLNGMRVQNPSKGIYIVRQGSKVVKKAF